MRSACIRLRTDVKGIHDMQKVGHVKYLDERGQGYGFASFEETQGGPADACIMGQGVPGAVLCQPVMPDKLINLGGNGVVAYVTPIF